MPDGLHRHAMRVLLYLGAQPTDPLHSIAEMARSYDISQNHLWRWSMIW